MNTPELLPETEIPLDRQLAMAESMIAPAWRNVAARNETDPNYKNINKILDYTGILYKKLGAVSVEGAGELVDGV